MTGPGSEPGTAAAAAVVAVDAVGEGAAAAA